MRTIGSLTLEDLMAEDCDVWLTHNPRFGYDIAIEGDDISDATVGKGIHPYAIESLSHFCRRFLYNVERLEREELSMKPNADQVLKFTRAM